MENAGAAVTRRNLLRTGGALVVSILVAGPGIAAAAGQPGYKLTPGGKAKPPLVPAELDSWIAVRQTGEVVAYFGKTDVGLGIYVAIGQIVADELDVPFESVTVIMGDTATTINQGGASGSTGIERGAVPLRNVAAEARHVLLGMAASKFNVPTERLRVDSGVITDASDPAKRVTYSELIGGRYFDVSLQWNGKIGNELVVTGQAVPKNPADYKVVGQSIPRSDISNKVFALEDFITDVKVPGMVHGRMIRPPVAGSVPVQVDKMSVQQIPGARVVWKDGFLGVVADKEWDAIRAARQLKVLWSETPPPFPEQATLYEEIAAAAPAGKGGGKEKGMADMALAGAAHVVAARYQWPFQSHASMGPACAFADVGSDHATIWTGDQKPHYVRDGVAAITKLPRDKVHGIWVPGPGSYGRNDSADAAIDAAVLSQAVGKPVRLQGMRADGTAWDPKGPASVHDLKAGLDANGNIVAYVYNSKGFSRDDIGSHPDDPRQSLAGQLMGMPLAPKQEFDLPAEGYDFPNQKLGWETVPALLARASPLRSSHLRDPVGPQINFASESFIDELAVASQTDPVAFRLRYLKDPRGIVVIKAVAERAGWQPRLAASQPRSTGDVLTGRGIAYARRKETRVAVITEVEVDRQTGRVWPRRWFVAHDCGLIINPDTLRRVIEGNILHATSRALFEEVKFDRRTVTSVDWLTYPILDITDAPQSIEVVLINHPDKPPRGAGEPSSRPVASAIANAVYDATGIRIREAPLTKQRIKAALV